MSNDELRRRAIEVRVILCIHSRVSSTRRESEKHSQKPWALKPITQLWLLYVMKGRIDMHLQKRIQAS